MRNTNTKKATSKVDKSTEVDVVAELEAAHQAAEVARVRLWAALARVRGTRDMPRLQVGEHAAPLASVPPRPDTLAERVRATLAGPKAPMSVGELARELRVPAGKVSREVHALAKVGEVVNAGDPDDPRWSTRIPDDAPFAVLRALVEKLVRWRPLSLQRIVEITGVRRNRISGAIVDLQRGSSPVQNRGTNNRALWYIPGN